jgi:hypothetical protein
MNNNFDSETIIRILNKELSIERMTPILFQKMIHPWTNMEDYIKYGNTFSTIEEKQ